MISSFYEYKRMIALDAKSLKKIEFDKIVDMLRGYVISPLGEDLIEQMKFFYNKKEIEYQLRATSEARYLLTIANLSLSGLADIRTVIKQIEIKSTPALESFVSLFQTIDCYQNCLIVISKHKEDLSLINSIFLNAPKLGSLSKHIKRCISPEGYILDDASPTLKSIRRQILNKELDIKRRIESITQSSAMSTYLQEKLVTTRQGKYVIPVKSEHRGKIQGIIHDQSASGATLFIEPQVIVELSNDLRILKQDEYKEVDRILRELTLECFDYVQDLAFVVESMGVMDLLLARGYLSIEMNGIEPRVNNNRVIDLKDARHPLIAKNEVVSIDVKIGEEYTSLVITGPNTGGKTVSLKLIGLFQAMAQAGLHIPADVNSSIAIFDNILADVGDEQSIEQSLSTFSSHMKNIIRLLKITTRDSLVLLDELGAGTDPVEGAALAMAIIDRLLELDAISIATTHYSELKVYAHNHPKIINGSVEFDVETLSPTYKLSLGLPGKSNAFLIAEKLGLPSKIIERANSLLSTEQENVETLIKDLESDKKNAEIELNQAQLINKENQVIQRKLNEKLEKLDKDREKIIKEANLQAQEEILKLRNDLEETINNLRKYINNEVTREENINSVIREARKGFLEKEDLLKTQAKQFYDNPLAMRHVEPSSKDWKFKVGDRIFHKQWNREGYVVDISSDGSEAQIQCGQLKFWSDTNLLEPREDEVKKNIHSSVSRTSKYVPLELDIRGKTIFEAEEIIDKHIDNAILGGRTEITIIHGKGTGALRKGVQEYLIGNPYISEVRLGNHDEGGHGVTVAILKK